VFDHQHHFEHLMDTAIELEQIREWTDGLGAYSP
jgi:hypothetical protein